MRLPVSIRAALREARPRAVPPVSKRVVRRRLNGTGGEFPPDLHPVLARVYAARNVHSGASLDYSLARLHPYSTLSGIELAAGLLAEAVVRERRVLVVADFDADGATSCALALRGLRLMGARQADYLVPNRFEYGYGLTPEIVAVAATRSPDVLITVDNGISSVDGVSAAKGHGMQVIVTDHHLPGHTLPAADAIVNPNQQGDAFPSKCLAGVGVMFYLLLALRARLRARAWFGAARPEPNLAQLLDLVALGTVADVVPLDDNNRILVAQGLARIRAGRAGAGIRALLGTAGRDARRLVAADLAFAVAPRLNAAGRLTDMSLGIECLVTDDDTEARSMAAQLDGLNRERREIESEMNRQAVERVEEMLACGGTTEMPFGLCIFDEQWHPGVVGILASRIKDRWHRPVIAFAPDGPEGLKGSARSIPGLHIRDCLDAVAAHNPGLLTKFGGHAMAAGVALPRQRLDEFQAAFDTQVRRHLSADDLMDLVYSDGALSAGELGLELAELLRNAGPWGQGFPEPVFDGAFDVIDKRQVGGRHLKMLLGVPGSGNRIEAIAFNANEAMIPGPVRVHIAYRLQVNHYRGLKSPQLVVEHINPAP